jgi:hypothetical protein
MREAGRLTPSAHSVLRKAGTSVLKMTETLRGNSLITAKDVNQSCKFRCCCNIRFLFGSQSAWSTDGAAGFSANVKGCYGVGVDVLLHSRFASAQLLTVTCSPYSHFSALISSCPYSAILQCSGCHLAACSGDIFPYEAANNRGITSAQSRPHLNLPIPCCVTIINA